MNHNFVTAALDEKNRPVVLKIGPEEKLIEDEAFLLSNYIRTSFEIRFDWKGSCFWTNFLINFEAICIYMVEKFRGKDAKKNYVTIEWNFERSLLDACF